MHLRVDGAGGGESILYDPVLEEHILHPRAVGLGQTFTQLNTTKTEILRLGLPIVHFTPPTYF